MVKRINRAFADAVRTEEIKSMMRLGVFKVVDEKDYHDNAIFSVGRDRCDRDVGLRSNSGSKRLGRHGGGLRRWCLRALDRESTQRGSRALLREAVESMEEAAFEGHDVLAEVLELVVSVSINWNARTYEFRVINTSEPSNRW